MRILPAPGLFRSGKSVVQLGMRPSLYFLLFFILSISLNAGAAPEPLAKKPQGKGAFGVKYIGEPGSNYTQPSGAAADVLETASRQEGGQGTFGPIGSDGKPSQEASVQKPSAPKNDVPMTVVAKKDAPTIVVPKSEAARDAVATPAVPGVRPTGVSAVAAAKEVSVKPEDRSRYSLWDGLTGPADIQDPRIKEAAPQAAAPASGSQFLVEPFAVKGSEGKLGEIFVRFEIDLAKAEAAAAKGAPASRSLSWLVRVLVRGPKRRGRSRNLAPVVDVSIGSAAMYPGARVTSSRVPSLYARRPWLHPRGHPRRAGRRPSGSRRQQYAAVPAPPVETAWSSRRRSVQSRAADSVVVILADPGALHLQGARAQRRRQDRLLA